MDNDVGTLNYIDKDGNEHFLAEHTDNVVVIFNSAINSKFADTYYNNMQYLYSCCKNMGLVVLDFPSTDFLNQNEEDTLTTINILKEKYKIDFTVCKKIEEDDTNKFLFYRLSSTKKFTGFNSLHPLSSSLVSYWMKKDPLYERRGNLKWVFTTFIISRDLKLTKRFECTTDFSSIEREIRRQLNR